MKKRIYISGKVTDGGNVAVSSDTRAKFAYAASAIEGAGHIAVNPLNLCRSDWSWEKCMTVCIGELLKCDHICILPDWEDSKGARIEVAVAEVLFNCNERN
jgi:hypothetical protein